MFCLYYPALYPSLNNSNNTNAIFDVYFFELHAIEVIIEHCLQVSIMTLVARPLIIDCIGEKGVEAKADEKWLADLDCGMTTSELE